MKSELARKLEPQTEGQRLWLCVSLVTDAGTGDVVVVTRLLPGYLLWSPGNCLVCFLPTPPGREGGRENLITIFLTQKGEEKKNTLIFVLLLIIILGSHR